MEIKGSTCNQKSADVCALHRQWDELSCPICMEHPHNAVLLMCSSHDKGCRSYICDTSYRHSNCLDRLKMLRLIANPTSSQSVSERNTMGGTTDEEDYNEEINNDGISSVVLETMLQESSSERRLEETQGGGMMMNDLDESNFGGGNTTEPTGILKCPLCRGTVFGWKIIKDTREYLDLKSRSCSRESCSFSGSYRELRRHARRVHPTTRPADVEPSRQRAWRRLEHQRDYGDILSAIRSAMPGATVFGDYVIDNMDGRSNGGGRSSGGGAQDDDGGALWTTFFLLHMFTNPPGNSFNETRSSTGAWRSHRRRPSARPTLWGENLLGLHDDEEEEVDVQIPRRQRRRIVRPRADEEEFP